MFSLIKLVLIVSLNFSSSSAIKCVLLNDERNMVRSIPICLNLVDLKYYRFMISLDKSNGNCNFLSPKICVPKKTHERNKC